MSRVAPRRIFQAAHVSHQRRRNRQSAYQDVVVTFSKACTSFLRPVWCVFRVSGRFGFVPDGLVFDVVGVEGVM